ncbi:MAG: type VII secretion protein EccB, partial [Corynebacterium sp.]|nr:type VII secretion protein EccB [Corynebacterium sp.]
MSGYAFLLRRTELALVIGDPRMAQDPLRTQRRAIGVGLLLSLLVAGGMLLVAMLRPQPSIDGAGLVADESGALHVRIDDVFHPVTNVASARLLLGSTEEVTRSTSAQLSQLPSGPPVGISDAPGVVAAASSQWALCRDGVVAATGGSVQDAGPVVVDAPNGLWLVVDDTRMLLGPSDGIGGQLARAVGAAPVPVTEGMLQVLRRGPDVSLGALDGLVTSGDRVFLAGPTRVAEMTGTRRAVAEVLVPTPAEQLPLAEILSRSEMTGTAALSHVPAAMSFD